MPKRMERNLSRKSKTRFHGREGPSEDCPSNTVLRHIEAGNEGGPSGVSFRVRSPASMSLECTGTNRVPASVLGDHPLSV